MAFEASKNYKLTQIIFYHIVNHVNYLHPRDLLIATTGKDKYDQNT